MDLNFTFANPAQKAFYYANARNQCFSGGFNNGKSYGGCLKAVTLLTTFPNYRMVIARQVFADLKRTTFETFMKICPSELIVRSNLQDGLTVLWNGSQINWMHLDSMDEKSLRGLEVNSVLVDQAEEVQQSIYDVLDARIGRWDDAIIPQALLDQYPHWPKNEKTGKYIAPSYHMLLCNPDTQWHFIYRKYHPDSLERRSNYFFVEGEWDASLSSSETYTEAKKHDEEWIKKYIKGIWGLSNAQIHFLPNTCLLNYSSDLIEKIKAKGNLFRTLDHGDASPSCCLWWAAIGGVHICYREYYVPNQPVSFHRKAIAELSEAEEYSCSWCDPQMMKKTAQSQGGFWTMADEYLTDDIDAPAIPWVAADNNEFATRNRINELLKGDFKHPITGEMGSPGIYFIKKSPEYPSGCFHAITQLQSQRRKLLDYIDGKAQYCDDRDDNVTDHAYDPIRYYVAMHGRSKPDEGRKIPRRSFKYYMNLAKSHRNRFTHASTHISG